MRAIPRGAAATMIIGALYSGYLAPPAAAQDSTLMPTGGGQSPMMVEWPNCAWTLFKPEPLWAWLTVRFDGAREYARDSYQSGETETSVSLTLNGEFLPSQSLECVAESFGVERGTILTPMGIPYSVEHNNPSCDGYPAHAWAYGPGARTIIDESVGEWPIQDFYWGIQIGQHYWGDVGSQLHYTELNSVNGTWDGIFTMSGSLPPTTPANFSPESRLIRLNQNLSFTSTQWGEIAAHELGHAIGFDHMYGANTANVMRWEYQPVNNVLPRVLDKCAAVQAFPVPLR